ncbi:Hypothetical predicted protein [Mytilus galloprovincialis]|uniref:Glycosyltransferase family 92 protein n=1 Tax=Mytilus galloprovincialis TaxID=29158 RepID=A0A8B6G6V9_MYTGA|nr:Hypothetical predicted protein [Mytilus galloprovincialis]
MTILLCLLIFVWYGIATYNVFFTLFDTNLIDENPESTDSNIKLNIIGRQMSHDMVLNENHESIDSNINIIGRQRSRDKTTNPTEPDDDEILRKFMEYQHTYEPDIYLYSAISIQEGINKFILINGWERKSLLHVKNFTCCLHDRDGTNLFINSTLKSTFDLFDNVTLHSVQYACPVRSSSIQSVSVSIGTHKCEESEQHYINVESSMRNESGLAICGKISYGNMDAELILEWFEVQRLLGVDKVLTYTYKLNDQAMAVLEYYESIGYAVIMRDFEYPLQEEIKRSVGEKAESAWSDLQVLIHDCESRLHGYKYVAVLDKDEFYIPNITKHGFKIKSALNYYFGNDYAGISALVKMHMTSWKPSNESSDLIIGKYLLSTAPVYDNVKYIYMPSRTKIGSVSVHSMLPKRNYDSIVLPDSEIALHHYRKCRTDYWFDRWSFSAKERKVVYDNKSSDDLCFGFRKYYQKDMAIIMERIRDNVLKIRTKLNVTM